MRITSTERARVPWQCRSATGKSVLTEHLIGVCEERASGQYSGTIQVCVATQALLQTFSARRAQTVVCANEYTSKEYRHDENWLKTQNGFSLRNPVDAKSP